MFQYEWRLVKPAKHRKENSELMANETLEIVMFRTRPEVDRERFLSGYAMAGGWLRSQPGYQSRSLFQAGDQWIALLRWRTHDDAIAALAIFPTAAATAGLMAAIDHQTIVQYHAHEVSVQ